MALKLNPEPTFKASVRIPVPGGESEPVEFVFRHRTLDDLTAWRIEMRGKQDFDVVTTCVVSWGLNDEFNDDNVRRLLQNYGGAGAAIAEAYMRELMGARRGN
jgi:hypothetical protein